MRAKILLLGIATALVSAFGGQSAAAPANGASDKVDVCHFPPGNPDIFHTISVREANVDAHLAHGDLEGSCNAYCDEYCDDGLYCTIDWVDNCEKGNCLPFPRPVKACDDGVSCTNDSCNEDEDRCDNVADDANCEAGFVCDPANDCVPSACPCWNSLADLQAVWSDWETGDCQTGAPIAEGDRCSDLRYPSTGIEMSRATCTNSSLIKFETATKLSGDDSLSPDQCDVDPQQCQCRIVVKALANCNGTAPGLMFGGTDYAGCVSGGQCSNVTEVADVCAADAISSGNCGTDPSPAFSACLGALQQSRCTSCLTDVGSTDCGICGEFVETSLLTPAGPCSDYVIDACIAADEVLMSTDERLDADQYIACRAIHDAFTPTVFNEPPASPVVPDNDNFECGLPDPASSAP